MKTWSLKGWFRQNCATLRPLDLQKVPHTDLIECLRKPQLKSKWLDLSNTKSFTSGHPKRNRSALSCHTVDIQIFGSEITKSNWRLAIAYLERSMKNTEEMTRRLWRRWRESIWWNATWGQPWASLWRVRVRKCASTIGSASWDSQKLVPFLTSRILVAPLWNKTRANPIKRSVWSIDRGTKNSIHLLCHRILERSVSVKHSNRRTDL